MQIWTIWSESCLDSKYKKQNNLGAVVWLQLLDINTSVAEVTPAVC